MADLVLAGSGNSADSVRVVTDGALQFLNQDLREALDEAAFWREERHELSEGEGLSVDGIIAPK